MVEEYIQITVRCNERKDIDIRVHEKQKWDNITNILYENGFIPKSTTGFYYKSLRLGKGFEGRMSSKEAGIYTGDIVELGGK